ncbi:universal stress protein [Cytobacillus sp. S13-E01]|uniref:universal stress protein n=1 Tax=Cytobacillus sp. S13-E01 TaxID=3031326 RepID=UPI0023D84B87|nr:universal stress protein [Cytobacillus sp. S13-E01]MDF0726841.1 universal stress protein [Cytobacillus sp. S13-E01]
MFNKILLASDGSKNALRAAEKAAFIAKVQTEAMVTILYVVDSSTSKADVLSEGSIEAIRENRYKKLWSTEEIFKKNNSKYEVKIVKGEPGPTIVQHANENKYNLVIIGSRGLGRLQVMILGSVSHKVAKRVDCPVMIDK